MEKQYIIIYKFSEFDTDHNVLNSKEDMEEFINKQMTNTDFKIIYLGEFKPMEIVTNKIKIKYK